MAYRKKFAVVLMLVLAGLVFLSAPIFAENLPTPTKIGLPFEGASVATSIGKIIRQAIMFAGVLAVMALTYGGILMMISYGDENKVKGAKSVIQYALIGVVLTGAAYAIIEAINALKIN